MNNKTKQNNEVEVEKFDVLMRIAQILVWLGEIKKRKEQKFLFARILGQCQTTGKGGKKQQNKMNFTQQNVIRNNEKNK